ncbi:MAG: hypothetical protein AAB361_02145 [Patescibacteria group bacterium]
MGSSRLNVKKKQKQEKEVELPNQCLGNRKDGGRCKKRLPENIHLCNSHQKIFNAAGKMEMQMSFAGGNHRRVLKNPSDPSSEI